MVNSSINDEILKKIDELTKDKNERIFCRKILNEELEFKDVSDHNFKAQFKRWLQDYFPLGSK